MLSRRVVLGLGIAVLVGGVLAYGQVYQTFDGQAIDAAEAQKRAARGEVTLIDIRRPDEWADTGYGADAMPLDMRDADFLARLTAAVDGNRDAPIALICARGVRSTRLANQLTEAGFTQIINVPEGMLGSSAGPGWIARNLPVSRPE